MTTKPTTKPITLATAKPTIKPFTLPTMTTRGRLVRPPRSRGLGRAICSRAASPSNTSVTGVTAEGRSPEAA
jgi:hypothetical protein